MPCISKKSVSHGFTLVELLVALTIMSIVLGLLMNSISFSIKSADVVESRIAVIESVHQSLRALRRQLQLALPLRNMGSDDRIQLDFTAKTSQVDFVAPVPGISRGAGLYRISLKIEGDVRVGGRDGRLVMSFRPYPDTPRMGMNNGDSEEVVILDNFSRASFSFFDAQKPGNKQWSTGWQQGERLPDLVRLSVDLGDSDNGESFDLIVAIKATSPAGPGQS
jgi:general secretion pathway protein J